MLDFSVGSVRVASARRCSCDNLTVQKGLELQCPRCFASVHGFGTLNAGSVSGSKGVQHPSCNIAATRGAILLEQFVAALLPEQIATAFCYSGRLQACAMTFMTLH